MGAPHRDDANDLAARIARECVGRLAEEAGADSIVLLWTATSKRRTAVRMHSYGNQLACAAMVERAAEQFEQGDDDDARTDRA